MAGSESQVGKVFSLTRAETGYAAALGQRKLQAMQQIQVVDQEINLLAAEIATRLGLPPDTCFDISNDKAKVIEKPPSGTVLGAPLPAPPRTRPPKGGR